MPSRKFTTFKVSAEGVQGKDAYVVLKYVQYGEMKRAREGDLLDDELLQTHVLEWNWVDDAGKPLPQVKDEPAIVYALPMQEKDFLIDALVGSVEERKN